MACASLRIVVFPETPKTWTARSLEHDLMAAGRTAQAALDTLVKVADAHMAYDIRHGHQPLSAFGSAPQLYWNAFSIAKIAQTPVELTRSAPERSLRYVVGIAAQNPALRRLEPPLRIA
jgi:hypothetical protein